MEIWRSGGGEWRNNDEGRDKCSKGGSDSLFMALHLCYLDLAYLKAVFPIRAPLMGVDSSLPLLWPWPDPLAPLPSQSTSTRCILWFVWMEAEAAKNNLPWHSRQTIHLFSTSSHISCFWSCCTYFAADCQAPAIVLESTTRRFSSTFYYLSFQERLHKPNVFLEFCWFWLLPFDLKKYEIFFLVLFCWETFKGKAMRR